MHFENKLYKAFEITFPDEIILFILSFLHVGDWNSLSLVCKETNSTLVHLASHNLLWKNVLQQRIDKDMVFINQMCAEYKAWIQQATLLLQQLYHADFNACKSMLTTRRQIALQVETRQLQQSKQLIQKLKAEDVWLQYYEQEEAVEFIPEKDHANRCKVIVFEQDEQFVQTIVNHSQPQTMPVVDTLYSSDPFIYDAHHLNHFSINNNTKQIALEMVSATPLELEQISPDYSFEMDKSNYSHFVDTNLFIVLFKVIDWHYFVQVWSKYVARIKGNSPHAKIVLVGYGTEETRNAETNLKLLKEKAIVPVSNYIAKEICSIIQCQYYELQSGTCSSAEVNALFQRILSDYYLLGKEKESKRMCVLQ